MAPRAGGGGIEKPNAPQFHVVSVDHGLRREARREMRLVAETCRRVGLPHKVLRADVPLGAGGIQQAARELRYRLMAGWCAKRKIGSDCRPSSARSSRNNIDAAGARQWR